MEEKHLIRFRLTDKEYEVFKAQVEQSQVDELQEILSQTWLLISEKY